MAGNKWNPEKELKGDEDAQYTLTIDLTVESGEGIESDFPRLLAVGLNCDKWNPEKELKVHLLGIRRRRCRGVESGEGIES